MAELVAVLASATEGTAEERQQHARAAVATIVGAVTVARALPPALPPAHCRPRTAARALPPGDEARAVLDAASTAVLG